MKNWKKWAAGICALSLCMTAVSLPAAAEGEDDIALISDTSEEMPAADGTADADTADDTATENGREAAESCGTGHPVHAEEEFLRRHHFLLPSGGL